MFQNSTIICLAFGLYGASKSGLFYEQTNDPRLFKKLQNDFWEFRTKYAGLQIRLLAFWDKMDNKKTLVVATHGFIKKVDKVPANEIDRAIKLKEKYFNEKQKK
ncbi:MAG: type II toxin-antitoxin system RelE/ParE family toxin [Ignavibacteria bacterium]|nr:type II toxin-antitoxin system RelE/ParE family toxin [Ignavibacteria bacterium]